MRMQKRIALAFLAALFLWLPLLSSPPQVQERFPKPDFQTDYTRPDLLTPPPRAQALEYLDLIALVAALTLATYFAHRLRSRRKLFILMALCLAYFGFFRKGCVCSVGAVQNIGLALFDPAYAIPLTVILFFLLPLVFALFFGRTFCAAVCPLGAVQDVMVLKPSRVPAWLAEVLGIVPYLYLGLAVLFAATGAGFIICRYDPFIGFFRFGASFNMILFGASILLLGTVVARPYCRFLCPYGVLLGWMCFPVILAGLLLQARRLGLRAPELLVALAQDQRMMFQLIILATCTDIEQEATHRNVQPVHRTILPLAPMLRLDQVTVGPGDIPVGNNRIGLNQLPVHRRPGCPPTNLKPNIIVQGHI